MVVVVYNMMGVIVVVLVIVGVMVGVMVVVCVIVGGITIPVVHQGVPLPSLSRICTEGVPNPVSNLT